MVKVGEFKSDGKSVWGPERYMKEQGNAKLDSICSGEDVGFNTMMMAKPDVPLVNMILVALQTDYAGWKGLNQLLDVLKK